MVLYDRQCQLQGINHIGIYFSKELYFLPALTFEKCTELHEIDTFNTLRTFRMQKIKANWQILSTNSLEKMIKLLEQIFARSN